jgi:predicted Zn-dependent protease
MSDRADAAAGAAWRVGVHDARTTASRAGVARLDDDRLVVEFADGARLDMPLAGCVLVSLPAGTTRGQLAPSPASPMRIVFDAPALAAALAASAAYRVALHVAPALAAAALLVLVALPLLADRLAARVPAPIERQFGAALAARLAVALARSPAEAEICRATAGRAALDEIFARLVAAAGPLPHPPVLQVVGASAANAYALPGGRVLLSSGMIDAVSSPDELAGVLAHELAHVAHRDPVRAMVRSAALAALAGALDGDPAMAAGPATLGVRLLGLSYSRDAEALADARAAEILARAGLAADGLARLFARLAARAGGDATAVPAYPSTHPPMPARARLAGADAASSASSPALTPADWQALRRDCAAAR